MFSRQIIKYVGRTFKSSSSLLQDLQEESEFTGVLKASEPEYTFFVNFITNPCLIFSTINFNLQLESNSIEWLFSDF